MLRNILRAWFLLLALSVWAAAATPDIGNANELAPESGDPNQALLKRAIVHGDDILINGTAADDQTEFLEWTAFALGRDARVVFDKFVYGASAASGKVPRGRKEPSSALEQTDREAKQCNAGPSQ